MLGCNWWWAHGLQANVPRHHLCQCRVLPTWHRHSISHDRAKLPPHISRQYSRWESPLVGESQSTPPLTELPPWPVKPLKTVGGSRPEDGVTEASWPVTPGVHEGQHQMSPQLPPRKSLHLNEVAMQRPHAMTPALLAGKFRSCGWKKDLEHVLKVYYKHNLQAPFREAEWARVRDQFFEHFLPHKEEALSIKERSPLDFMPLIEEQFWRATGLHLHGLRGFTLWIKQGSYYHGLVAQQGHLQRCPHLVRAPLPRWPQITPSESCQDSHKRAEALAAGSSEPSARATTAPCSGDSCRGTSCYRDSCHGGSCLRYTSL